MVKLRPGQKTAYTAASIRGRQARMASAPTQAHAAHAASAIPAVTIHPSAWGQHLSNLKLSGLLLEETVVL